MPGVLSAVAWDNIPRKAFVASIDIKGLKSINETSEKLFGKGDKRLGDQVLNLFAQVAARLDGSDFDFAHLSGDEYAAQHDSQEKLQAWLDAVEELTKAAGVPLDEVVSTRSPSLRALLERRPGNADRVLNAASSKRSVEG